ncbi:hypothetical protein BN77_p40035 [Rhizobium mesoamericanum STM3625]|uniref:Uncharacterized protein n=1 Tax=Rhizobium mesoamericanum STM3625 TaxID=1211777 RepID=K0Q524_9HYPH|nr:hypothetical protein BN77_p40035 [Rhizobium mesoamericanum STM3625]
MRIGSGPSEQPSEEQCRASHLTPEEGHTVLPYSVAFTLEQTNKRHTIIYPGGGGHWGAVRAWSSLLPLTVEHGFL